MANMTPSYPVELARRIAEEVDAIVAHDAAPDCTELLQTIHARFEAECVHMRESGAEASTTAKPKR